MRLRCSGWSGRLALFTVLFAGALCARSSQATPISYSFSMRVISFLTIDQSVFDQRVAEERAYLLANPGAATPDWNGTLSYDADTGEFAIAFIAPYGIPAHPISLGGTTSVAFSSSADVLSLDFESGDPSPRYFSRGSDYLDVVSWFGLSTLVLEGTGVIADGGLRHGLVSADLTNGYLWGEFSPFDMPQLMYTFGCPPELNLVECAYGGYQHYQDSSQTLLMSIAEIHEIPEASHSLYAFLALAFLATARRSAALSR